MLPHKPSPDWAVSCMKRITKFDDPDVLQAALELVTALGGLNLEEDERSLPMNVGVRADAAQAAVDFGYRKTTHCDQSEREYLGLAV